MFAIRQVVKSNKSGHFNILPVRLQEQTFCSALAPAICVPHLPNEERGEEDTRKAAREHLSSATGSEKAALRALESPAEQTEMA